MKRRLADQGVGYLVNRCQQIGPSAGAWVVAVRQHRPIESIRVMQGLLSLGRKVPHSDLAGNDKLTSGSTTITLPCLSP